MATQAVTAQDRTYNQEFRRGVVAVAPLWVGVIPFAITVGVSAQAAGFSGFEAVALSAFVFAGAAQVVTISLFSGGAGILAITLTTFLLNLRHVLYGMSLDRRLDVDTRPGRPILAAFLTDESYGIATRDAVEGRGGAAFYVGVSVGLYVVYVLSTIAGVLLGAVLPSPERIGLDFIFPLMFVALLIPLLRTRRMLAVALVAASTSLALGRLFDGGITILLTTLVAAAIGATLDRR